MGAGRRSSRFNYPPALRRGGRLDRLREVWEGPGGGQVMPFESRAREIPVAAAGAPWPRGACFYAFYRKLSQSISHCGLCSFAYSLLQIINDHFIKERGLVRGSGPTL